jgi:hypothetical protein
VKLASNIPAELQHQGSRRQDHSLPEACTRAEKQDGELVEKKLMTAYCSDNKCDPHEEIEASEYVVKDLLPVLGWRGANDVFAIL